MKHKSVESYALSEISKHLKGVKKFTMRENHEKDIWVVSPRTMKTKK